MNLSKTLNTSKTISEIKTRVKRLPLVKESVSNTLSVLNNPNSSFDQISDHISPGVAAQFLKIANKVSTNKEIGSLNHAIKFIGFSKMKQILSASVLMRDFAKQSDFDYFSFDKFNRQAHFSAVIATILGQITEYTDSGDLYTAALLLNIGKLIIAIHFTDEHKKIIELKKLKGISTSVAEEEVMGISHPHIGAMALEHLKIPKDICDAVRYHDTEWPIPKDANYQLIMICRESSKIVDQFKLPININLTEIKRQLQLFIEQSRKGYQKNVRVQIRAAGYKKFFPELLKEASEIVVKGMADVFKKRTRLSIISKNQED